MSEQEKKKASSLNWNDASIQEGCAKYQEIIVIALSRVLTLQTSCSTKCALFESKESDLLEFTSKLLLIIINWPQKLTVKKNAIVYIIISHNTCKIRPQSNNNQLDFSAPLAMC